MSGYLPQSEGELARNLPWSNRANSFPREGILAGEKVVFETKPRRFGLHPVLFWAPIPFLLVITVAVVAGALSGPPGSQPTGSPAGYIVLGSIVFLLPIAIPSIYAISSASRTAYALTDRRVVLRSGSDYQSLPYDRVARITTTGNSTGVAFQIVPTSPPAPVGTPPRPVEMMHWKAVRGAPAVAAFAASAQQFYALRLRQRQLRQDIATSQLETQIVCQYCGGVTTITRLNATDPRCPRCGAPFVVLPTIV